MLSKPVQVIVVCAAGLLSIAQHEARRDVVIGFFRHIKIKNKYYIVYNNSI